MTLQQAWLDSRGGRNESDILIDGQGEYIRMGDGDGGTRKVYIPNEHFLRITIKNYTPVQVRDRNYLLVFE